MTKFKSYLQCGSSTTATTAAAATTPTTTTTTTASNSNECEKPELMFGKKAERDENRECREAAVARNTHRADQTRSGSRESKWWRSCWNGNQLDSELLYQTIKAQQEHHLAERLLSSNGHRMSNSLRSVDEPVKAAEDVRVNDENSCRHQHQHQGQLLERNVYATPRPSEARRRRATCWLSDGKDRKASEVENSRTENPEMRKQEPLYSSILGPSKQLKIISSRLNLTTGCSSSAGKQVDPAALQLRSLVERCLEVQWATRNSSLLHSTASSDTSKKEASELKSASSSPSSSTKSLVNERKASSEEISNKQTKLLQLNHNGHKETTARVAENNKQQVVPRSDQQKKQQPVERSAEQGEQSEEVVDKKADKKAFSEEDDDDQEEEEEDESISITCTTVDDQLATSEVHDDNDEATRLSCFTENHSVSDACEHSHSTVIEDPSLSAPSNETNNGQVLVEGNEIVIDSHSISLCSSSSNKSWPSISVKPIDSTTILSSDASEQNNTKQRSLEKMNEAARCNDLIEFSSHYKGKVWHIKHFCCAECKIPLDGQQYIMVDQTQTQRAKQEPASQLLTIQEEKKEEDEEGKGTGNENTTNSKKNKPFCLRCFDRLFGETCEQCGKLITCESAAINHEQRSWHANGDCFKCHHCSHSLLGSPFLSGQDGRIYCSLSCSEAYHQVLSKKQQQQQQQHQKADQFQVLSLANYCDPRAPLAAQQLTQLAERLSKKTNLQVSADNGKDQVDGRERSLVSYLLASAHTDESSRQLLAYLHAKCANSSSGSSQELRAQVSATLRELSTANSQKGTADQTELSARRNKLNPFLRNSSSTPPETNHLDQPRDCVDRQPPNYINLDTLFADSTSAQPPLPSKSTHGKELTDTRAQTKPSQCSPVASVLSNEGTMSDHSSATSSGVSTAPGPSSNGSPNSPLSSVSSQTGSIQMPETASIHQLAPPKSTSANKSVAASLERRRRVQPITELSVAELLSTADERLEAGNVCFSNNPQSGIRQLSAQAQDAAAFEQLINHFEGCRGSAGSQALHRTGSSFPNSTSKHSDSFFYELAQRLPPNRTAKHQPGALVKSDPLNQPLSHLDTQNRLDVESLPPSNPSKTTQFKPIDHYSTVNKPSRQQQQQQKQLADTFFALTSPLLTLSASIHEQVQSKTGIDEKSSTNNLIHPAYSTSSLNRNEQLNAQKNQAKTATPKPAKSVSFDPTVRDPPISGSMTLGRSSALKSALKANPPINWQSLAQQNQQLNSNPQRAAYTAHYDQYGRRVKLSSLAALEHPSMRSDNQGAINSSIPDAGILHQRSSSSSSIFAGALSKLSLGSRGGRREERRLRERQQQQQLNSAPVLTSQPVSLVPSQLFVQPIAETAHSLQQPVASCSIQQQYSMEEQQVETQQPVRVSNSGRAQRSSTSVRSSKLSHRHTSSSSSRTSRRRGHSSSCRDHNVSRYSSRRRAKRRSSYCRYEHCYESDDLSSCSTCSSLASSDDEFDRGEHSDTDSSSASNSDSNSGSSRFSSRSSYSSYTSRSNSPNSSDEYEHSDSFTESSSGSSRSSSPCSSELDYSRGSSPARSSPTQALDQPSSNPTRPAHSVGLNRRETSSQARKSRSSKEQNSRHRYTNKRYHSSASSSSRRAAANDRAGHHSNQRYSTTSRSCQQQQQRPSRSSRSSRSSSRSSSSRSKFIESNGSSSNPSSSCRRSSANGSSSSRRTHHRSQRNHYYPSNHHRGASKRHEHRQTRRRQVQQVQHDRSQRRHQSSNSRSSCYPTVQHPLVATPFNASMPPNAGMPHLQPQVATYPSGNMNLYMSQQQQPITGIVHPSTQSLTRSKSPSTISMELKSGNTENCRII